ncbi:ATP-dependent clp protease proteolytic [Cyclospora cayetanensis]|uniref:ATP-dependent Clp protease proteolytic subunit n=1 Tax=Cyclospora cayetanensis TaxID=88456 RepID=A0A1D3D8D6_9EIME|nr:ATP-dependent clp protease proteolytic [Cyclospora cayetanensis]
MTPTADEGPPRGPWRTSFSLSFVFGLLIVCCCSGDQVLAASLTPKRSLGPLAKATTATATATETGIKWLSALARREADWPSCFLRAPNAWAPAGAREHLRTTRLVVTNEQSTTPFRGYSGEPTAPKSLGVPNVLSEEAAPGVRHWVNLYDKQKAERVLFLFSELGPQTTEELLGSLLLLEETADSEGRKHSAIYLHIHSTGGSLTHALAVLDLMQMMSSPVYTVNCGLCASSASLLLAGGAPGHRYALGGSRVLLHLPMGALAGPLNDLLTEADGVKRVKDQVERLYGQLTSIPPSSMASFLAEEKYLDAEGALQQGIVDSIIPLTEGPPAAGVSLQSSSNIESQPTAVGGAQLGESLSHDHAVAAMRPPAAGRSTRRGLSAGLTGL